MKFLVDAQLPRRLAHFLNSKGLDAVHTLDLPNKNTTPDDQIVAIADSQHRVVISKDIDFLDSFILHKQPSKLLLVSTGNIGNSELLEIFDLNLVEIITQLKENAVIELTQEMIVVHY